MSTHKNIDRVCILVLVLMLLLTVGFMNGEKLGIRAIADEDAENYAGTAYFTENDLDGAWKDNAYTTCITLSGDSAKVSGSGAYAYDGGVVIASGGWYVLSGTLTDGSILVDAEDTSKVWLRLEGVEVNCSDSACLIVEQADKVFLSLAEGTENAFVSGGSFSAAAQEEKIGGAIFSRDDLTIHGSGSLTVTANYRHGIDANDSLVITGGTISVSAPQDGIHVNDSFRFAAACLTVSAGDDAIHSDGELYVESGTILITDCCEGLEALTVDIAGGDITIYPTDDGINASGGGMGQLFGGPAGGMFPGQTGSPETGGGEGTAADGSAPPAPPAREEGAGGTAAESGTAEETYIRIRGGTVTIINEHGRDADGLDSNGSIYIDGGTVRISLAGDGGNNALDFGSESGGELLITGGTVVACGGSSMAEEFSAASTQCAVLYNLSTTAAAGTAFRVLDAAGEEVLAYSPPCAYSSVAFSATALALGETYTVCVGDTGTELTLLETTALLGETAGMGGPGSGGGMPFGDRSGTEGFAPQGGSGEGGFAPADRPTPPDRGSEEGSSERRGPRNRSEEGTEAPAERPAPPDAAEGGGEPGSVSGEAEASPGSPESADTGGTSMDAKTWLLLGLTVPVLAAGILFAARFKRH